MRHRSILNLKFFVLNYISKFIFIPYKNIITKFNINLLLRKLHLKIIKIIHFFLKIIRKNFSSNFLLLGQEDVNWSIDFDRKNAKYFLELNQIKISEKLIKSKYIFCVFYDFLLRAECLWLRILKHILNYYVFAVITNDIRIQLNRWKIDKLRKIIDIWICPSIQIYNFLKNSGCKTILMPFFVDKEIFYPLKIAKEELCNKLGLDYLKIKNKIVIGSYQRDTHGSLEKPKWQKNPDLLIEILKKIPKDIFILLLAGPRRHYIISQCEKYNIPYLFFGNFNCIKKKKDDILINNHSLEVMNLLYNLLDLYIVNSTAEGGPKAILESSLTKTLIFSTDVGLAKDFIHEDLIYSKKDINKIIEFILKYNKNKEKIKKWVEYNFNRTNSILSRNNYKKLYHELIIFMENENF